MTLIKSTSRQEYRDTNGIVVVSNTNFKTFKSFSVSRTIDGVCGEFKIVISRPKSGKNPFKTGNIIDIQLDGVQIMRGKIYNVSLQGDATTDDIVLSGRDITADLIDSTVPDDSKVYTDGVNIFDIATKIILSKGLSKDIQVINSTGSPVKSFIFGSKEIISCRIGETVISFLQRYCRKKQLFLNTDAFGNLVFFKAKGVSTGNQIINRFKDDNNNVIEYKTKYDITQRFNKYICKSQSSALWGESTEVNTDGEATDFAIDFGRELEFKMEEGSIDASETRKRAQEESNVRRARGFEYLVTVQGFTQKTLWRTNQFVQVFDGF